MPQNRVSIPAAIERQVLIEAGHRCAVCGTDFPLERAHIIPWRDTQDHSFENLICLCANCHQRADTEDWGRETLRQYKQKPWVIRARTEEAAARATTVSPLHQLPPPPADFTGREADLAELREAVESNGVTISGIRGMGGIGKTALALKLADELMPKYPDAQIYLDLKGVSAEPVPSARAMEHVIRSFYPEVKLPESENEIQGLYRTALHGRRALLLMDNAADLEQVEPLLPPAGCLLLVTSRFHFYIAGLQAKNLEELPLEHACALLLRITPRIGKEAGQIAEICAGLPFALLQAAGTLSVRPDLSPAGYAERLAQEKQRLGLVEGSLSLSYDLLPKELVSQWRTLAVFAASFDAFAAARVWEVEQEAAEEALGDLVRRSLVIGQDGRYRLHDLAVVFAKSRRSSDERDLAERRHSVHYRDILEMADDLFLEGGRSLLLGLQLMDLEWPNIQAGQAWAAFRLNDGPEAASLTASYPEVSIYCLDLRLRPTEQISWLEPALQAARLLNDLYREGNAAGNLGNAYLARGETRRAIELYEQYLSIARKIGDRRGEGNAIGNLGLAYAGLGDLRQAVAFYEQHLALAREIGDQRGEGTAAGNLGLAHAALGEIPLAIDYQEQCFAIARKIGDRRMEGNAVGSLGNAYAALGKTGAAIVFHQQRLAIAWEIRDRRGEGNAAGCLGNAYAALGELDRAIEFHERSLAIARDISDRKGEGNALGNLGSDYAVLGEIGRAIEMYKQQLAITSEICDRQGASLASWNLGNCLINADGRSYASGRELMQVRVDYLSQIGHPSAEACAAEVAALRKHRPDSLPKKA